MEEEKKRRIRLALGISDDMEVEDYSNQPRRFLVNDEIVSFSRKRFNCWTSDEGSIEIYFSQLNGVYIKFNDDYRQVLGKGNCELILKNHEPISICDISSSDFNAFIQNREFKVEILPFNYFIVNKAGYKKDSSRVNEIIEKINNNTLDAFDALNNKIIKKGNCYRLIEI